jgi:YVTN family beta-propeller protein
VWAASDVALNEGNNAVTAQVTDLGGNSTEVGKTLVFQADLDQDGSHNNVDRKPRFPSADFSDQFTTGLGWEPIQLAVTPNGERVYVAAFASGLVSVLDTATSQVSTNIPVGGNPFGVAISPDGARAYGIRSQGMEINFLRSMRDPGHGRRSEP